VSIQVGAPIEAPADPIESRALRVRSYRC